MLQNLNNNLLNYDLSKLTLLKDPNPLLRIKCDAIDIENMINSKELSDKICNIFEFMYKTMSQHSGIGLSANQVGILFRLVVIDISHYNKNDIDSNNQNEDQDEPNNFLHIFNHELLNREIFFLINPKIIHFSNQITPLNEGCLSVNDKIIKIHRPNSLTCNYFDLNGNEKTLKARGLLAKVIQHELDHLDGKLILDYL